MIHKLLLAMMVCGTVGGMLFFTGCRHEAGRHPDPEKIVAEIGGRLDLDEGQQERLKEMVIDLEAEMVALHDAQADPHAALLKMVRSERLDGVELQQLYTAKREAVDLLAEKLIAHLVEFHALLTPEQRETLAAKMEDHHHGRPCRFFRH
jgi:Spy/CpxP family protein refolding chaperone